MMAGLPKLGKALSGALKPMTDAEYDAAYGPSILNGVPLRTSVSSLQTLDPNTYGGCHRKWWYEKIAGKREPESKALTIGKRELHEPIETYYKTGEERFSPLVLQGRHLLYPYGAKLLIEREIAVPLGMAVPEDKIDLSIAPLRVDGIPLVGRVDLTQMLGYYIDSNGERQEDPPNTAEVNDWKSTGKREYAKRGSQLMTDTIQMPGYGKWLTNQIPSLERVRLSHSYFCKDPRDRTAWKATVLVTREELDRRWEYVDGLGRVMRDVAREPNVERIDGNRDSCNAYGRKGCPHKPSNGGTCSLGEFNSLSRIFGDKGASRLLASDENDEQPYAPNEELIPVMGLLKNVNGAAAATNLPGTPANVQAQNTPAHVGVNVSMPAQNAAVDMLAALAAEQAAPAPLAPDLVDAFDVIVKAQLGCPALTGAALAAHAQYIAAKGMISFVGTGRLNGLNPHTTTDEILALANNLRTVLAKQAAAAAQQPAPATTAIVSPETPASDPKLAAAPIESAPPAAAPATVASTPSATTAPAAPKDEPKAEAPKTRRTRKPKPEGYRDTVSEPADEADGEQPFELYVDCVPSVPFEFADQHISMLNVTLCKLLKVTEIPDIRSAGKSVDALAFGAWKGTYEALAREAAADGHIPRARYVVFTAGNELAQLFVNALIAARHKSESGVYDGALVLDSYTRGV